MSETGGFFFSKMEEIFIVSLVRDSKGNDLNQTGKKQKNKKKKQSKIHVCSYKNTIASSGVVQLRIVTTKERNKTEVGK